MAERSAMLHKLGDGIEAHADEIARAMVQEQGKPLAEAAGEVAFSQPFVRYFADLKIPVEVVQDDRAYTIEVHQKPLGVVVGNTPWNFPFLIPVFKLALAVLMGNSFILKPAPTTKVVATILGEIAAGIFPAGVVTILVDDNDLGPILSPHPDVAKVSFTGSTATGKRIVEGAASTLKRLTLELGGNDAGIVLPDADVQRTAKGVVSSSFMNAGQVSIALKRLYVPESIYDQMIQPLAEAVRQLAVGHGLQQGISMRPTQSRAQYEKAKAYLEVARRDGRIVAGGDNPEGDGYFISPTLVADISDGSP